MYLFPDPLSNRALCCPGLLCCPTCDLVNPEYLLPPARVNPLARATLPPSKQALTRGGEESFISLSLIPKCFSVPSRTPNVHDGAAKVHSLIERREARGRKERKLSFNFPVLPQSLLVFFTDLHNLKYNKNGLSGLQLQYG